MIDADLIPELRWHEKHGSDCLHGPVCKRAADEIERLRQWVIAAATLLDQGRSEFTPGSQAYESWRKKRDVLIAFEQTLDK